MSGTYMAISAVGVGFIILVYLLIAPPDKKKRTSQPRHTPKTKK